MENVVEFIVFNFFVNYYIFWKYIMKYNEICAFNPLKKITLK